VPLPLADLLLRPSEYGPGAGVLPRLLDSKTESHCKLNSMLDRSLAFG
jgi:hypothetical protein